MYGLGWLLPFCVSFDLDVNVQGQLNFLDKKFIFIDLELSKQGQIALPLLLDIT